MCTVCSKIGKRVQHQILLFQKTIKIAFESNILKNFPKSHFFGWIFEQYDVRAAYYLGIYIRILHMYLNIPNCILYVWKRKLDKKKKKRERERERERDSLLSSQI